MKKTFKIQVKQGFPSNWDKWFSNRSFIVLETIERVLRAEQCGNFNPIFCRYGNNKRCLVQSEAGDLSDPFRRTEEYAQSFFIHLPDMSEAEELSLRSAGLHPLFQLR